MGSTLQLRGVLDSFAQSLGLFSCPKARPPISLFQISEKKFQVRLIGGEALDIQCGFAKMVIAPQAGLAAGDFVTGWDKIPPVRMMVNRMKQ